ncbi:DNA alkylation repair protein [Mucilaginibacter glaciei]|uniref:DNA alkylation repair protein n=1 Tax=Mucilaginibacter glaciei TaxID=2772109 RepID=A0A926NQB9_9SPHI|nr:DNA alkylation repair protein [Mucilaginibacter glaciei]MBD1395376.1 DNA alkylation repair protein [Mucilaginibacter glaciei]
MTVIEIMAELESKGSDNIKKILLKHGVKEPFFGVKIEYLKPIQKKIKKDYQLAKDLFATGNADAMYLAGLIADDEQMTNADLQLWVEQASSTNIGEYTVPWVAAGGRYGFELGLAWIDSPFEHTAASGWATLNNLVALKPDDELDMDELRKLVARVEQQIHSAAGRVAYMMNAFMIGVGSYVAPLADEAMATANSIGPIIVDMNGTACKVPVATEYIMKVWDKRGGVAPKKKDVKC